MAITLAIFAAAQVATPLWIRPHLIPPERTVVSGPTFFESAGLSVGTLQASTVPGQPSAWILSSGAINAAGQPVSTIPVPCLSPSAGAVGKGAPRQCRGLHGQAGHPGSHHLPARQPSYGSLQWIETATSGPSP